MNNNRKPCYKRRSKKLPYKKLVEILCGIYPVETVSKFLDEIEEKTEDKQICIDDEE